jgi:hypothetical protein
MSLEATTSPDGSVRPIGEGAGWRLVVAEAATPAAP